MCPVCWALNAQTAAPPSGQLQTAGLIAGVIAIFPCCPITLASLVLNTIALIKSARSSRWKPAVGLCLTLVGGFIQLFIVFYQIFSGPR